MRFLLILFLLCPPPAAALGILEAYRRAQDFDAEYSAARAMLEAGRERLPQARAGLLPSLTLSGNATRYDDSIRANGLTETARYSRRAYALTLSQPLFRWQNLIEYEQGKISVALSEARFMQSGQDLILRVAEAYFAVLNAQSDLAATRTQKEAIAQQFEQARQYYEVGAATIVDTSEAQSRHDLVLAQEIAGENELEVCREALRVLIGEAPMALAPLDPEKPLPPPQPAQMAPWVEAAQKDNLAVQIAAYNDDLARREVDRAKAGHYPTLDIVANVGGSRSTESGARVKSETGDIGVQLNLPLFTGGYVSSQAREAVANQQAALALLEAARRNAMLSARQNFLGVVNGLARIRALKAALASSLTSLEHNKTGYEVGVRINIDVLNAEQQVFTTRRDLARAYHDTLLARLRLKGAIGTLDERDVAEIDALLESGTSP
ncbi:MAG: TolC family outer membrane protein [Zoogloeaceae bacterium]|jgi:outer membrane protein|nr:TolC family outer membrane protein [Zoogloeaceae bacterium]